MRLLMLCSCCMFMPACYGSTELAGDVGTDGGVEGADGVDGRDATSPDLCGRLVGEGTLYSRSVFDDYERATFSFEYATALDTGAVGNDWDLLFTHNTFVVNMVVDDESCVLDLGDVDDGEVPAVLDPDDYPTGMFGEHDHVTVLEGHVYWIRTSDSNTRQVALARVVDHPTSDVVTFEWIRSTDPDLLVMPPPECFER